MSDKIQIIRNFKEIYMNNIKKYSDYNDSLYQINNFNSWKENLIQRSIVIRTMFKENQDIIDQIDEILTEGLDDDTAYEFLLVIKEFKDKEIHDASIMIKIINYLIAFYEPKEKYEILIYLYTLGALEEMEFFLRMDNDSVDINPLLKYQKILALKSKYQELNEINSRRDIFIAYYNLIGPLADLNANVRKDIIKYYEEVTNFYNSDLVQSIDKDNEIIKEEMHLINDVFITSFSYFIDSDYSTEQKYFKIVNSLLETEEVDDDQKKLIELAYKYSYGEYDVNEMIAKLTYFFNLYLGDGIKYEGTDENLNRFCNLFDIAGIILELLRTSVMDPEIKYSYLKKVGFTLLDYIKSVPYKDFTSYFDDVSSSLYKSLLPFCENLDQKVSLLNLLVLRRQPITYIHSIMVKKITVIIANEMLEYDRNMFKQLIDLGYDTDEKIINYLGNAALFHDIGKCLTVGVINLQNRKLTDEEFKYIKMHPSKSKLLLGDDPAFDSYYDVMLGHHRTYDGKGGYPLDFDILSSKYKIAIDLIAIADSIDAATDILGRNYTTGKNFYTLLEELKEYKGTRYNPEIIDFISSDEKLKKDLDNVTGRDRASVYYDVYKEIIK
ncbi:MAG: hypothetical protein IJS83_05730 [Acholeplasmatales bacterium]|nr:hypothetical protein [Acholeplasmatales bacterium]